jgi:hypothetical protein
VASGLFFAWTLRCTVSLGACVSVVRLAYKAQDQLAHAMNGAMHRDIVCAAGAVQAEPWTCLVWLCSRVDVWVTHPWSLLRLCDMSSCYRAMV